jgi:hypothetical protein
MNRQLCSTILILLIHAISTRLSAQESKQAILFSSHEPLSVRLDVSLSKIRKHTDDSTYIPIMVHYKTHEGLWDSIPATVRTRGHFRKEHCFFPPLRIKFKKKDTEGTVFEGTKSLKLVMPCQNVQINNDLILKEFLCYQLYEAASRYVFKTRLVDITLNDQGKHINTHQLQGIFIEDDDAAAKRYNAKVFEATKVDPLRFQDTSSLRLDFFQYMIANTDFSTQFLHNIKAIQTKNGHFIPIAYDFDMSGVVNASYATYDEKLGIKSVRERYYKGYCRDEKVAQAVREDYINREQSIIAVIAAFDKVVEPKEIEGLKKYLNEFFATIKNDRAYSERLIGKCRSR